MRRFFLVILILTIVFVRLYHSVDLFFWHADQDIVALTVKKLVIDLEPVFLGFMVPGGIFIGPAAYFILAPLYLLANFNPDLLAMVAAALGLFAVYLTYVVAKMIFETRSVAILASIIFGLSFLGTAYSRFLTSLSLTPILALFGYFFIYRLVRGKSLLDFVGLAVVVGLSLQNDGTSFSLVVLAILSVLFFRIKLKASWIALGILIVILAHLPFVYHDFKKNFFFSKSNLAFFVREETIFKSANEKISLVAAGGGSLEIFPKSLARYLFISGERDIAKQLLACPELVADRVSKISPLSFLLAVLILAAFLISAFLKSSPVGARIVLLHLLVMLVGLTLFNLFLPNYFNEWTMYIFFPGFALIAGYVLTVFAKIKYLKPIVALFLVIFVFINLKANFSAFNNFGLHKKIEAVKYAISQVGGRPFYLESQGSCFAHGWLYLFWYWGQMPVKTYGIGEYFEGDLIPKYGGEKPNLGVVIANPSNPETDDYYKSYNFFRSKAISSKQIDKIEVLLVD